jgi:hypothetical protein
VSTVGPVVERTAVDGVPVLWANGPEPYVGALVFRVGLADETLATLGLSHLVEHLALHAGGRRRFDANGFVDETRTVFWAAGTREEVCGFLADVAAGIGSLPLERLDTERRVLLTEAQARAANPLGSCSAAGSAHGLRPADCVELPTGWTRTRSPRGRAIGSPRRTPPSG